MVAGERLGDPEGHARHVDVSRQFVTRNYCLFKCLPGCLSPTREGFWGFAKGGFPKGWFWRMFPGPQNRNEGTKNRTTDPENRNEGTKNGTTVPKTGMRALSPKPPFYKTTLFFLEALT